MLTVYSAAAKDIGADAETFTTYLDQDTSRVLALIRRTLQQVQEHDDKEPFNSTLRQSLNSIRLYVQSICMTSTKEDERSLISPTTTSRSLAVDYNGFVAPSALPFIDYFQPQADFFLCTTDSVSMQRGFDSCNSCKAQGCYFRSQIISIAIITREWPSSR